MSPPCAAAASSSLSMASCSLLFLLLLLFPSAPPALASPSGLGLHGARCNGTIAECGAEEEFVMDSEIHRRILQGGRSGYIGYPVIRTGDRPVCNSGRGNAYTGNCAPERSNPRTRPCNDIYRCNRSPSR